MNSRFILQQANRCFNQGGLIAYPTESVYGLGCDPLNESAVEYLLQLKNRPLEKGLILLTDQLEKIQPFITIDRSQLPLLKTTEATTWLIEASELAPGWIKGQHKKVAIRITRHPVAQALCRQLDRPIVSTSANPSRKQAAKNSLRVRQYFHKHIDFIVSGKTGNLKKPTRIIDLQSQKIIRA